MVDVGVFPGNYHDYESDEMAVQRTREIGRNLHPAFVQPLSLPFLLSLHPFMRLHLFIK